ncbi:MAG: 50S ribosomal protein L11 methyltransferase, partial [Deltaproteobacteria bacterium]|nr:50S ribosomal protein L11 methyltransferase [Deltaproteobacteria bacterium]
MNIEQDKKDADQVKTIVKLSIETDPELVDTVSDYLVGVCDAAVEFQVDKSNAALCIHGFMHMLAFTPEKLEDLTDQVAKFVDEMARIFQLPLPRVSSEVIADQDWSTSWRDYFKPFEIVSDLIVAPSWDPHHAHDHKKVIVLDPGMAFGTGHHATTRLCLKMIASALKGSTACSLLDVGTGTGILGMAAILFGAMTVVGVDNDDEAVRIAKINVQRNNLEQQMRVSNVSLNHINQQFEVVVANILHNILWDMADHLERLT